MISDRCKSLKDTKHSIVWQNPCICRFIFVSWAHFFFFQFSDQRESKSVHFVRQHRPSWLNLFTLWTNANVSDSLLSFHFDFPAQKSLLNGLVNLSRFQSNNNQTHGYEIIQTNSVQLKCFNRILVKATCYETSKIYMRLLSLRLIIFVRILFKLWPILFDWIRCVRNAYFICNEPGL